MINKKLAVTFSLLGAVAIMAMAPARNEEPKFTNLKVLPKNISDKQLHEVMEEWEHALGARCSFCHVRNEDTKKMDWANDGKPEKEMARKMYKMMNDINKKYFHAKKDSTGMMITSGVNCYSCHRGSSHPEVVEAAKLPRPKRGPGGPPPGKISGTDAPTPTENKPAEAPPGRE